MNDMTATNPVTPATPKKLRSGEWGAWAQSEDVRRGDLVLITTRGGKSWQARISRVLWAGKGGAICATQPVDGGPRGGRPIKGLDYCGYPCPVTGRRCTAHDPCHDCQ